MLLQATKDNRRVCSISTCIVLYMYCTKYTPRQRQYWSMCLDLHRWRWLEQRWRILWVILCLLSYWRPWSPTQVTIERFWTSNIYYISSLENAVQGRIGGGGGLAPAPHWRWKIVLIVNAKFWILLKLYIWNVPQELPFPISKYVTGDLSDAAGAHA